MNKKYDKNSFKTPKGYFEDLNSKIYDKLGEEGISLPKKEGFVTPDGYFEGLSDNISAKLGDKDDTKVVQLHPYKKYYYAVAAVAAIALLVFGLQWNRSAAPSFDSLASNEIENYLEEIDLGFSTYEIAEVVEFDELEVNDILDNQLNEENIIDYLDENVDDFDELNLDTNE